MLYVVFINQYCHHKVWPTLQSLFTLMVFMGHVSTLFNAHSFEGVASLLLRPLAQQ